MNKLNISYFLIVTSFAILSGCDRSKSKKNLDYKHKELYEEQAKEQEQYDEIISTMLDDFEKQQKSLENELDSLNQTINNTLSEEYSNLDFLYDTSDDPEKSLPFDFLYKNEITEPANNALKSKYSRRELAFLRENPFNYIPLDPETYSRIYPPYVSLLQNKELVEPDEEPYIFLSPEGEFLEKNKKLYEKLRKTSPWHEQGILSKECGLKYVETADQEFSQGHKEKAETAYQSAHAMVNIAKGELPMGKERTIYESCTGKDLLTGLSKTSQTKNQIPHSSSEDASVP